MRWATIGALLLALLAMVPAAATAENDPWFAVTRGAHGPILTLVSSDYAAIISPTPPARGWEHDRLPLLGFEDSTWQGQRGPPTIWMRFNFDRAQLARGPIAILLSHPSERFVLYLNGVDIARNASPGDAAFFGWNRPWLVPLPQRLLREDQNQVKLKIDTETGWNTGIAGIAIGSDGDMRAAYKFQFLVQNLVPRVINVVIIFFTLGVMLCWYFRPSEPTFGWLAAVGLLWFFRNIHYYADAAPMDPMLFQTLTVYAIFALMIALYGFAATFINIPSRRRVIVIFSAAGAGLILLRFLLLAQNQTDTLAYFLTVPMALTMLGVFSRACAQNPNSDSVGMLFAIALAVSFSFHDYAIFLGWWRGAGFYLQPYASIIVFAVFAGSLFRRILKALGEVEVLNASLAERVAQAAESLKRSESARRALEVNRAVEQERERMMREIHDGIGSNLITALAIAERHPNSGPATDVLRNALTDLRIAVDSLEPIEGDIAMLIGSLRHRMEPELNQLGVTFVWDVSELPEVHWLDAVSALHILRFVQEAIGNVLRHSRASRLTLRCHVGDHHEIAGVIIEIQDDGRGFDVAQPSHGKGLRNMAARAEALGGAFGRSSALEKGTQIRLWLPFERYSNATNREGFPSA